MRVLDSFLHKREALSALALFLCFSPLQDGHELPPPISFDVEAPTTLPACKVQNHIEGGGERATCVQLCPFRVLPSDHELEDCLP